MGLYSEFKDKSYLYYDNISINPMDSLNNTNCYKFINEYFDAGEKQKVFDLNFRKLLMSEGKHIHTVILYYLGCRLKCLIEKELREDLIKKIRGIEEDGWYNFKYTWFLTCLYHDTASVIEKGYLNEGTLKRDMKKDSLSLNELLKKYNVQYKVFNHIPKLKNINLFTYNKSIVNKYFFYSG